jgi:hypothetical protein
MAVLGCSRRPRLNRGGLSARTGRENQRPFRKKISSYRTGRAARRAARGDGRTVLSYPIWMWHWARPADPLVPWRRACRIPLSAEVAARKRSAIGAFASQLAYRGAPLGPVLPHWIVAHFTREQEVLLL